MTTRLEYPEYWASSGTATDPDLDTTHPAYEPDKYEDLGWHSEKPPEEWQNFLTQISDLKVIGWLFDGAPYWDVSVTYQIGSVCKYGATDSKVYIKVTAGDATKAPDVAGSGWDTLIASGKTDYNNLVNGLFTAYNSHLAADNPHNDTVDTLVDKSYIKSAVDAFFGSPTDPQTIVYHKNRQGASVHGETPAQLGTLPVAGGTFTGPVIMEKDVILNLSPSKLIHLNKSTAVLELASGTVSVGIDGAGNCFVINTAGTWPIMTQAMYESFQCRWGNRFALPLPNLDMHLTNSLSDASSVGGWIITATSAPVFHIKGGVKVDDNILTFQGFNVSMPCTIHIVGRDASGNRIVKSGDAPSAGYTSMATLLSNMGMTTTVYVERIAVFPQLSSYQKSMLVS